jgi:SAM-dependent methyltransferase
MLARELFGADIALPDFPVLKGIRGIGISDSADYAERLAGRLEYRNTQYHKEPQFDIVNPPKTEWGRYDFLIASEVFEHVAPPVDRAFRNAFRLLKPHGVFLFTVPYTLERATAEHFPGLYDYGLAQLSDRMVLVNRTMEGSLQVFDDLVFHGGRGSTLEIRRFTETGLRDQFRGAGFNAVEIYAENYAPFGVLHSETWSLPMVARKEPFRFDLGSVGEVLEQSIDLRKRLTTEVARLNEHAARQKAEYDNWVVWAKGRIEVLEREVVERTEWAQSIEKQFEERTQWAFSLEKESAEHLELAKKFQAEANEKGMWAMQLQTEVENLQRQLQLIKSAPWTKAGRAAGFVKG